MRGFVCLALLCVSICAFTVLGDTVHLSNGTSVQGRVIDQGDKYWVKDDAGETHLILKSDVKSITRGSDGTPPGAALTPGGGTGVPAHSGSSSYAAVKTKADNCDTPIAAVTLWQGFVDSKPAATDLASAKLELKHWQDVMDGGGEKINGKWIWGEEHVKLIKTVRALMAEGTEALGTNQTLLGITKFEQAVKLYPNNFEANFELGYYNLLKGIEAGRSNSKIEAGIKSMELAVKLRPNSAAALSDLAIAYSFKHQYKASVDTAYKAVKIQDSKETVQNLVNSISYAPPGMQNNSEIKPIMQEAILLAGKYGITPSSTANWVWVRPSDEEKPRVAKAKPGEGEEDEKDGPAGPFSEGTGFFIAPTGYILTNRHVAKPGDYLLVRLPDNSLKLAERIVVDDQQDMAVIKIKTNGAVPFIRLAGYDHPSVGADVAVFGFPLLDRFGLKSTVKMTRGIVTAWDSGNELCDVTVDAIVNPGNSGGPMVDHHGNLLALTAMKTIADTGMVTTYGLGYSTARVRKFFTHQNDKLSAAKLEVGKDDGPLMTNEDLATKLTPCTVCILACRGTPPTVESGGQVKLEDPQDKANDH